MKKTTIADYAKMLCQFETLDKIKGKYLQEYFFNTPAEIKEEIDEIEAIQNTIVENVDTFRKEYAESFERLANDLHIVDGKTNTIEFVDINENLEIKLVQKQVNIDDLIKDAYKRTYVDGWIDSKAWKLDIREFEIKAVKKMITEEILSL